MLSRLLHLHYVFTIQMFPVRWEIIVDELIELGPSGIIFVYFHFWQSDEYGRWAMDRWAFDL